VSDFLTLPELVASFSNLGHHVVEMVLANPDEMRTLLTTEPVRHVTYTREYLGWGVFALMALRLGLALKKQMRLGWGHGRRRAGGLPCEAHGKKKPTPRGWLVMSGISGDAETIFELDWACLLGPPRSPAPCAVCE
jgi:hypothetical protein